MTDMWRTTISIPEEMEAEIMRLRKTDKYCRSSLAEIIRDVIRCGLKNAIAMDAETDKTA